MSDIDHPSDPDAAPIHAPEQHRTTTGWGLRRWLRMCRKEMLETLRDRRTILTLLLMPVLVYPLLSMGLNRFLLTSSAGGAAVPYRVGVASAEEGRWLEEALAPQWSQPPPEIVEAAGGDVAQFVIFITTMAADETFADPPPTKPASGGTDPVTALREDAIDVAVGVQLPVDGPFPKLRVSARQSDAVSESARSILVQRLLWRRMRLAEAAANSGDVEPIEIDDVKVAESTPLLATLVPLVLVLMTITGAVYPAIDLTAGERERGTMEALMASPVSPFAVLTSKYVAVIAVALLTAAANLLAMFVTLWVGGLLPMIAGDQPIGLSNVLAVVALLALFASFFAALLLVLTSFARSFKEAQAYLIPVMLLSITPGMLSLLPGVTLSGPLAVVPLMNIVLLAREILAGSASVAPATAAVLSTLVYAAAALLLAAKLFGSDAVSRTSESSIGSLLKRPTGSEDRPDASSAALVVALLVPAYFVTSNLLMNYLGGFKAALLAGAENLSPEAAATLQIRSMTLSAIALWLIFGGLPFLAVWWSRYRVKTTYRLHRFPTSMMIGVVVLGLTSWTLAHEAFVVASQWGIGTLDADKIEQTRKVIDAWTRVPPWIMLLTLALTPAIVEELCFRGFLFSAFRQILRPWAVITLTSLLFGLFHVVTGNALLIERFVPSTLLGFILGWVAYRSGSVIPGMVMHFLHNGLLNLVGHYHKRLNWFGDRFDDQAHLPAAWIVVGLVAVVFALVWIRATTARHRDREESEKVVSSIDPPAAASY